MPRIDLPAKLSGAAFVHDVLPKDVLHARTLRQPNRGAALAGLDEAAIRRAAKGDLQRLMSATATSKPKAKAATRSLTR